MCKKEKKRKEKEENKAKNNGPSGEAVQTAKMQLCYFNSNLNILTMIEKVHGDILSCYVHCHMSMRV